MLILSIRIHGTLYLRFFFLIHNFFITERTVHLEIIAHDYEIPFQEKHKIFYFFSFFFASEKLCRIGRMWNF